VLFDEQNRQPTGVYTRRLDGSPAVRIDEGTSFAFSPDGRWVLTQPQGQLTQLVIVPTGPGEPKKLPDTGITVQWGNWLPDGKRLVLAGEEPGHGSRLYTLDIAGGKPRAFTSDGVSFAGHAVSPDGTRIAASSPDGRIALYPIAGGSPVPVRGVDVGEIPIRWSADGRAILVGRRAGAPGTIDRIDIESGARTRWKTFEPSDPSGVDAVGPAVVSADEKTWVFSYRRVLGDLYLATGLR
jgi:WD40 repeat protein